LIRTIVFAGTSEGRQISDFLSDIEVEHLVMVATEYGQIVLEDSDFARIRVGRLDSLQMREIFDEIRPVMVIDATHPFAVEVTANIKEALSNIDYQCRYLRIERETHDNLYKDSLTNSQLEEVQNVELDGRSLIEYVYSVEEAVNRLSHMQGNILLTTGVKSLSQFCTDSLSDRIYARILPSVESITMAMNTPLKPGQIIAMEGPFNTLLNEALIEQFNIQILVTKNSGNRGGFMEKIKACQNKNVHLVVIDKEKSSEGVSLEDGISILESYFEAISKEVIITGVGVGNEDSLTVSNLKAIKEAKVLIGAKRMIEIAEKYNDKAVKFYEYESEKVAEIIRKSDARKITVLVSGDSGFYSGGTKIYEELQAMNSNGIRINCKMLPSISSLSYFSSKIAVPYSGGEIISFHGTDFEVYLSDFIDKLSKKGKVFAIVSGYSDINRIIASINSKFDTGRIFVGINLGSDKEIIEMIPFGNYKEYYEKGLYIIGAVANE